MYSCLPAARSASEVVAVWASAAPVRHTQPTTPRHTASPHGRIHRPDRLWPLHRAPGRAKIPCSALVPTATRLLHDPRLLASSLVQVQDDLPDLVLAQEVLPHWHGRVPGCRRVWEPGAALGNAPEQEGF